MDLVQRQQPWCVRAQNWHEHVAASICADEEDLTVARGIQIPTQMQNQEQTLETETETDSCQY